jgi:hypothetical protein
MIEAIIMNTNENRIWFPAKNYGWGWGLPCAWQGWIVLGLFVALNCAAGCLLITSEKHLGLYIVSTLILVIALMIVLLLKGEKPKWRWDKS